MALTLDRAVEASEIVDALKPFGYDIFRNVPTTFAQINDAPVPPDYTIGPGDTVELQFLGNVKGLYTLTVGRDGRIRLPEIGPMAVTGMRFAEMQEAIEGLNLSLLSEADEKALREHASKRAGAM